MSLFIAMVVLGGPELPQIAALGSALGDVPMSHAQVRDSVVSFTLENIQINCGLVAAPIPRGELDPILCTSPYWRNDDSSIFAHQAHLIVAASGDTEKKRLALVLTRALSAILKATEGSIAVYWGAGTIVTPKDIFCDFADGATIEQLPLYLWVDFRCHPQPRGHALFTHGMKSLGFMEIEVAGSSLPPVEIVGLAFNVAHYLLDRGDVLKDGDTIGMSAEQKLRIRHVTSACGREETVYRIEVS